MPHRTAGGGVVATKLRMPALPAGMVSRPRLRARLLDSRQRIVLVAGPAGFGKTVLVTDWVQGAGVPCAWLSLDELDNDPRRFLNHLAAAFDELGGPAAARVADVLRALRGGADMARDAELLDALHDIDPAATLVVDDLHALESGPSLDLLGGLLDPRLPAPRLVLLSRIDPPLPLGRLRVAGQLLEVREQDLRFTDPEAVELFAALLPGGLEQELVARLERRTEGWAAGLRMAALALEHTADRRAAVDAFAGSHRFVADYLLEEAIGRQSADVQRFLMETSILPRFTADTCATVMDDDAARHLLREVETANLFLVGLGGDRTWYRYHQLFGELLQFRLGRLQPERLDELHARASRWFEEEGDVATAFEHAARMSTRELLAALLDRHAFSFLRRSEMPSLARWIRQVPDLLSQPYPTLLVSSGWLRVIGERSPDLEPLIAATERALDSGAAGYDEAARDRLRAECDILRAYDARFSGRFEEALRTGARVMDHLPPDSVALSGRILFNQGRVYMLLGEMERAAVLLERSIAENLRAGTHYLVLTGLGQLGAVLLETDGVPRAQQALDAAVRVAEERQLTRLPAFSVVLYNLGHVHTVADQLDQATACFERALALGLSGDMPDGRSNAMMGLARVHAAQGRLDEAERLLLETEALARVLNLGLMDGDVATYRRRLDLYRADATGGEQAPTPRAAAPPSRWNVFDEARDVCCMLEAVRAADPGARGRALEAAARIRAAAEPLSRHIAPLVARVVQAMLGDGEDRWQRLDDALALAGARQYVRPLLEIGPPLRPLLQAFLAQPASPAARSHARLLLERLPGAGAGASTPAAAAAPPPPAAPGTALTDREREVLEHLCRGLSNKAIGRRMFVSPETVKTHLKHIYDKLHVSRRRDAVDRARALGMVPVEPPPPAGG